MKYEKDDLRQRTKSFALRVIKLYGQLPSSSIARTLGHQLLRSATSVGANYREAYRARSTAEFLSKLGDCLKELEETAYWLELLAESGTISAKKLELLVDEPLKSPQFSLRSPKRFEAGLSSFILHKS
jgi:four helix bundle protein